MTRLPDTGIAKKFLRGLCNAMTDLYRETGERLRLIEKALQLKGAEIARLTENRIRASRWTEYCQGSRLITVESALALYEITGATLDYIYRGDKSGLPLRLAEALRKIED